jgi:hypothetical protein
MKNGEVFSKMICSWLLSLLPITLLWGGQPHLPENLAPEQSAVVFLDELFAARAQLLIQNKPEAIRQFYLGTTKSSIYAFQHEAGRSQYLSEWGRHRGIKFTEAESKIRIARILEHNESAKVSILHTLKLTYVYRDTQLVSQQFGVGTRHGITLKKVNGQWYVSSEWYSDPMDENPDLIPVHKSAEPEVQPQMQQSAARKYNRTNAVAYADKYAGAAWGAANDHRYNKKYKDYTHLGGDCTNFASQVIGDAAEGGNLPMTSGWYYQSKQGGSENWVRTDSFKSFLLYSGYGRMIARGSFNDVLRPNSRFPNGAFAMMQPGDLITYELKGDVDHFCILTGRDPKGYPLVNSHSGDRFHVPWDIGWDKHTKYSLIHMKD